MDALFSKFQEKEDSAATSDHEKKPNKQQHHQPSNSELMESAKYVAGAVKSTLRHESDKVDKAKAAGAAENLLSAASKYGKLEESKFGTYVEKAEGYLHQYHSSHSTGTTHTSGHSSSVEGGGGHHSSSAPSAAGGDGGGHEKSEGAGYGDYIKMAQGFLKK